MTRTTFLAWSIARTLADPPSKSEWTASSPPGALKALAQAAAPIDRHSSRRKWRQMYERAQARGDWRLTTLPPSQAQKRMRSQQESPLQELRLPRHCKRNAEKNLPIAKFFVEAGREAKKPAFSRYFLGNDVLRHDAMHVGQPEIATRI